MHQMKRSSKFDHIVVLGYSNYKFYVEQLRNPKVCVMSDDISTNDLLNYIKLKQPLLPSNTLWVLVTGIDFLFYQSVHKLCSDSRCSHPLQATHSAYEATTVSEALNTFDEMEQALNAMEEEVKKILNFKSDFIIFPPIPPEMLIDSSVPHKDLHKLIVKHPKSYIVTKEMASYYVDVFEKVSLSFTHLTWLALNNMGISSDSLENYLRFHQNPIDIIYDSVSTSPNKLMFFSKWLTAFRDVMSSCLGDSSSAASSDKQICSVSSTDVIFSDNEDEGTDSPSREHLNKNLSNDSTLLITTEIESRNPKEIESQDNIVEVNKSKQKDREISNNEELNLTETFKERKPDSTEGTFEGNKQYISKYGKKADNFLQRLSSYHPKSQTVFEESHMFTLKGAKQSSQIKTNNCSFDSTKLNLSVHQSVSDTLPEQSKMSSLELPSHSLQNDLDNFPLVSRVVNRTKLHAVCQTLSEKAGKVTKQILQIDINNSLTDSKENDTEDVDKEINHEHTNINKKNTTLANELKAIQNKVHPQSSMETNKSDSENKNSGMSNKEIIVVEKNIEDDGLPNWSSTSNQINEQLEEENTESDWEELLIREELEREILECDDYEENSGSESNKILNDDNGGELCFLVTVNKREGLETISEDVSNKQKAIAHGSKVFLEIENTNLTNTTVNLPQNANTSEIDMVETEEAKELEEKEKPAIVVDSTEDKQKAGAHECKPDKVIENTSLINIGTNLFQDVNAHVINEIKEQRINENDSAIVVESAANEEPHKLCSTNSISRNVEEKGDDTFKDIYTISELFTSENQDGGNVSFFSQKEISPKIKAVIEECASDSFHINKSGKTNERDAVTDNFNADVSLQSNDSDNNKSNTTQRNITFEGTENGEIYICHNQISESCSSEDKRFSTKVLTDMPANKVSCNDEVKGKNHQIGGHCQEIDEKFNETEKYVQNKIIKDSSNRLQIPNTEDFVTAQHLELGNKIFDDRNKIENQVVIGLESTVNKNIEECESSQHLELKGEENDFNNKLQNLDTLGLQPMLIKTIENERSQLLEMKGKESFEINQDGAFSDISSEEMNCEFPVDENSESIEQCESSQHLEMKGKEFFEINQDGAFSDISSEEMNCESPVDENSEENHKNETHSVSSSVVEVKNNNMALGNSLVSSNILALEKEPKENYIFKYRKIEETSPCSNNCNTKKVLNQSICSVCDPFHSTESNETDTKIERNKNFGVMHKRTVNLPIDHSLRIEIEAESDQKTEKSHKIALKSAVEDSSKTEIELQSKQIDDKSNEITAESVKKDSSKIKIQANDEKKKTSNKMNIVKKEKEMKTNKLVSYIVLSEEEEEDSSNCKSGKEMTSSELNIVENNYIQSFMKHPETSKKVNNSDLKLLNLGAGSKDKTSCGSNEEDIVIIAESVKKDSSKIKIQANDEKKKASNKMNIVKKEKGIKTNKVVSYIVLSEEEEEDSSNCKSEKKMTSELNKVENNYIQSFMKHPETSKKVNNSDLKLLNLGAGSKDKTSLGSNKEVIVITAESAKKDSSKIKIKANDEKRKARNKMNIVKKEKELKTNKLVSYIVLSEEEEEDSSNWKSEKKITSSDLNKVENNYIQLFMKHPETSKKVNNSDLKLLNLEAESEDKTSLGSNEEDIVMEKNLEGESLFNYGSAVKQNEEFENTESDYEEMLISEELEREILDDDEFEEESGSESNRVRANKILNDDNSGELCVLVTANKSEGSGTISEDVRSKQGIIAHKSKIVQETEITNLMSTKVNLRQNVNTSEIDMVETEEAKELEEKEKPAVTVESVHDLNDEHKSVANECKTFEVIENTSLVNVNANIISEIMEKKEKGELENDSTVVVENTANEKLPKLESTDHSSNIETESDQKTDKSYKIAAKSSVEDLSKTEIELKSKQIADKSDEMTIELVEKNSSKTEMQTNDENKEASYKFNILKKEKDTKQTGEPVPYIVLSDSEEEEKGSSNSSLEKKRTSSELKKVKNKIECYSVLKHRFLEFNKIKNKIKYYADIKHRYDHIYIIGQFNPLFIEKKKLMDFTFIDKSVSDLQEENVVDLLGQKGQIVSNSVCIILCDILDILTEKYTETKSITSKYQEDDLIVPVYELKESFSDITEGKLFISKSITSFIKIVDRLRNELPVVVMPLKPRMLISQFKYDIYECGADEGRIFLHGTLFKWTRYRDHFVKDWMRILDTNGNNINRSCIESFITKPQYVYPIRTSELKDISIQRQRLDWAININKVVSNLLKTEFEVKLEKSEDSSKSIKRKTSSSFCHLSPSPDRKRHCSRSPGRRQSKSPSSLRKVVKRPRSRERRSPPRTSSDWASHGKNSSSSVSPEQLALKKGGGLDSKHNKDRSSRSPTNKRINACDVKLLEPQLSPSPLPITSPFLKKLKETGENEQTKDLSRDRVMHRATLLKYADQCFDAKSLRDEFRDELYEEFEAEKNKTCFKLEEEFNGYKTVPKLYEKYEECYDAFLKMYEHKYPNHSDEEHKVSSWRLFFKAKLVWIEKTELGNRLLNLREKFKQKIQSFPSAPVKSVLDSRFEQSMSEAQSQGGMMKEMKESKVSEGGASFENFNTDKAIADLELMVPELEFLGTSINVILSISKEEGINSEKSLKSFADPENVSLMEFALKKMKAKYKEDRKDFYSSLERSVNGLIKYAKEELEKREKKELPPLDYKAIAKATIGKDSSAILEMIRTTAIYKKIELTKEQVNKIYMNVCSIHFNLVAK